MIHRPTRLSEPQRRALTTMAEFDCPIRINRYGHIRYGAFDGCSTPYEAWRFPPLKHTLLALERKGMVESKGYEDWNQHFVLTPKGCEAAKELQNDQTE